MVRAKLRPLRKGLREARGEAARHHVEKLWTKRQRTRPHGLPAPLVVSLTSYPPRFPTLTPTLKCLLSQSVRANRVILWIATSDMALLPDEVLALTAHGLEIIPTEDLRSFKKIIPALKRFPGCYIATADDDVFYSRTWLEELVSAAAASRSKEIICWRAHHIRLDSSGAPLPYTLWQINAPAGPASPLVFPTGVGGVLYPPRSLHPEVLNAERFQKLAPTSDDIWLYWMARMSGASFRKIGPRRDFVCWPKSQNVALLDTNAIFGGGNDIQFAAMTRAYGAAWREDYRAGGRYELDRTPAQTPAREASGPRGISVGGAGRGRSISF